MLSILSKKELKDDKLLIDSIHQIINSGFLTHSPEDMKNIKIEIRKNNQNENELWIGNVYCKVYHPQNPALVPHVKFFAMPTHMIILQRMLQDFIIQGKYLSLE